MEIRVSGHLRQFIEYTKDKLIVARFAHYSLQQIKRKWWAQEIANNLYEAGYGEYFFEVIRSSLGQEGSKIRNLFEQIVEAYALEPKQGKDREYLTLRERFGNLEEETLKNFSLDVMIHGKRVVLREKKYPRSSPLYRHARGSLRVEVRPSDGAVERHSKIQTMCVKDREHVESLP